MDLMYGERNREFSKNAVVSVLFGETNTTVTMGTADLDGYKLSRAIEVVIHFNKAARSDNSASGRCFRNSGK